MTAEAYWAVDGHQEGLVWSEDKDFDFRIRQSGKRVGRTRSIITHHEGSPSMRGIAKKKIFYLQTTASFEAAQPEQFSVQISLKTRAKVLLHGWKLALRHPIRFVGLCAIGVVEYGCVIYSSRNAKKQALTSV